MSLICEDLEKRGWNCNLCCAVCHGMGRYFTAVVRYKKTKHLQTIIACCKSMRCVFENNGWDLLSFDPDDGNFFECKDSTEMAPANWRQHMKQPVHARPPQAPPRPVFTQRITHVRKIPYVETHRRRAV